MIIRIKNLRAQTLLGAYDEERQARRTVVITLAAEYDAATPLKSDLLADALDYAKLEQVIVDSLAKQRFVLLESLAEHVAWLILGEFPAVREIAVEIDKPGALRHADSVSVVHTLKR